MAEPTTNQAVAQEAGEATPTARVTSGRLRDYGIFGALILIVIIFQIWTGGKLLMPDNLASLAQQNAYVMILAIGMVMVIIAGHIDLSAGSIVAFIGGFLAQAMVPWHMPWPLAVLGALAIGALIGAWQGFWIAYVGVPAFIVTLGGQLIFRGLAIVIIGQSIAGLPDGFVNISNAGALGWLGAAGPVDLFTVLVGVVAVIGYVIAKVRGRLAMHRHDLAVENFVVFLLRILAVSALVLAASWAVAQSAIGMPYVLVIIGVLIVGYSFVLNNSVFGRQIYAIGGNLQAAILSGVNVRKMNFRIFVNMGVLSAVAAIVTTSRAGAGVAAAGQNFELDAIAACFIGGTAVTGGVGRISGAIVGAIIMGVLNMGLSIQSVDPAWQLAVKGLVLVFAVAFDLTSKRRSKG